MATRQHRKRKRGKKFPRKARDICALPPGYRMRRSKYARPLTVAAIDAHQHKWKDDASGNPVWRKPKVLDLDANGQPQIIDNTNPAWPIFRIKSARHNLDVPGLILLYDANLHFVRIKAEETSLWDELKRLAVKKASGNPGNLADIEFYKVSRYRPEICFAVNYFEDLWAPDSIQQILKYYLKKFRQRERFNKSNGKPAILLPPQVPPPGP